MSKLIRIQIDFPEEKVRELDQISEDAGIQTRKELFNTALSFLTWAIRERENGNKIGLINEKEGTVRELLMPFLEQASSAARSRQAPAASAAPAAAPKAKKRRQAG